MSEHITRPFKHLLTLRKHFSSSVRLVRHYFVIFLYQLKNPCDLVLLGEYRQFITEEDHNLSFSSRLFFSACHCGA